MRRYCNVFFCDKQREFVCCATCQSRGRCKNRCLNDPSRCRLEDVRRREEEEGGHAGKKEQLPERPV